MRRGLVVTFGAVALAAAGCSGAQIGSGDGDSDAAWAPPPEGELGVIVPRETGEPPDVLSASDWGVTVASAAVERPVYTDPGEIPRLQVANEERALLPLEHTAVRARLTGFIAEVEVTQTYGNPYAAPIEAVYVFPLPENSAVDHMRMQIGDRVVEARIHERQEARQIYESARSEGYTAALLEQERPNVFTQSVANIAPGERIDVVVRYVQDLTYDAGEYEFVFPMVVGPRFVPGGPEPGPQAGQGALADTDEVPDASRISPPVMGRGQRSGHDISVEVVADATLAVSEIAVPTHEVQADRRADGTVRIALAEAESIPNRDFVLRYRSAAEQPRATLFVSGEPTGGYFSLVVSPPALDVDRLVGQREFIFVVDVSGSMSGVPISMCRLAMRAALSSLRPVDTFNVITFAGSTGTVFERPRPANDANLREAFEYVDQMVAGGGTYMADAVVRALTPDVEPGRSRYVFFLTDGYVGNEDEIIGAARRFVNGLEGRQQGARVFGFGVGSSVNRYLLEGLSRSGRGIAVYATNREAPARAVNQFFRYVDRSVLRDVAVDWADLGATDVVPAELPDLFASHALVLHGRYGRLPAGAVTVTGRAGRDEVRLPVTVRPVTVEGAPSGVLGALWARNRVTDLEEDLRAGQDTQAEITRLGLAHHLVTRFTSLVAVDLSRRVGQGDPTTVVQPVEVPEGVDGQMAGAVEAGPLPTTVATGQSGEIMLDGPLAGAPASVPAPSAAPPAEAADYEEAEQGSTVAYEVDRGPRGCHCRAGSPAGGDLGGVLAFALGLALALVGLRRRR